MKISISHISLFLFLLITSTVIGQNTKKADELYNRMGYQVAIDHYGDSEDLTVKQRIRLAESHRLNGHSEKAEKLYRAILKVDQTPIHYFHLAQALMMNNQIDEAIANFEIYKSSLSTDDSDNRSDNYLRFIQSKSFDQVGNFSIENVQSLNTDNFEFSPFIVNDGILFVSSRPAAKKEILASVSYSEFGNNNKSKDLWTKKGYNKIYKSTKDEEGQLNQTTLLSKSLKGAFHQGPLYINSDEDLLYFTSSHIFKDGNAKGNREFIPLEIYKSILIDNVWSEPVPFNEINTPEHNEAHPTLSENGKTIIFSSDREDGYGGMDLYIAHKVDGQWTAPKNMGSNVNTPGNEVFPFLHSNRKLYFSSDGLGGYGGLDIFHIKTSSSGKMLNLPTNVGLPINSIKDDFGYNSEPDDQSGYFSSSRGSSFGRDDIFAFNKGIKDDPLANIDRSNRRKKITEGQNNLISSSNNTLHTNQIPGIYIELANKQESGIINDYSERLAQRRKEIVEDFLNRQGLSDNEKQEAHPTLSEDGQVMIFSMEDVNGQGGKDLYISRRKDNKWTTPENMGPGINTSENEVHPFIHPNGKLYYSSDGLEGHGGLDIFHVDTDESGSPLNAPVNVGLPINSSRDDFGYNTHADDLSGYLKSSRGNDSGKEEVYTFNKSNSSDLDDNKNLASLSSKNSSSNNIGEDIKSKAKIVKEKLAQRRAEIVKEFLNKQGISGPARALANPTLSEDGQVMIYASEQADGIGGTDLYISHRKNNKWTTPENMGGVVNSPGNESNPYLHPNGKLYFSTDGQEGHGGLDIFHVTTNGSGSPLELPVNAGLPINSDKDDIYVFDNDSISNDENEFASNSNVNKSAKRTNNNLRLGSTANKASLVDPSARNKNTNSINEPYGEDVIGEPYEDKEVSAGASFTLDKIYYDFDKASLRDESIPELNKLTDFLIRFPDVTIELSSHTDSRGPDSYNERLSQKRAESVVDFLLDRNITPHRIIAKGYGEERLRNSCRDDRDCSEKDHQYNRRTEFKILDLGSNVNLAYTDNGPTNEHNSNYSSSKSFSNITMRESLNDKYGNINTSEIEKINQQLITEGTYIITVGAYMYPDKKIMEMKTLGFDKAHSVSIEGRDEIRRVLVGSLNDLPSARIISQTLYEMGIKNNVLTLD